MLNNDPLKIINDLLLSLLTETLQKLKLKGEAKVQETTAKDTPSDLCTPVFQLAKLNNKNPIELAKEIAKNLQKNEIINRAFAEGGFVNYELNRGSCGKIILEKILSNENFYFSDFYKNKKIIVEHTSANPRGPLHIGNLRGSIIGDSYANILRTVGANVKTHYYVDDLGQQIPVLAIGYELLKKHNKIKTRLKIDIFLGRIYGIMYTFYDIQKLKQELLKYNITFGKSDYWLELNDKSVLESSKSKQKIPSEKYQEFLKKFDFILKIQTNIHKRFTKLYGLLKSIIEKEKIDLPFAVLDLNHRYMSKEKDAVRIIKSTCEDVIRGHIEELKLMGITHDVFDWEAELQWSGQVSIVLENLKKNNFLIIDNKAHIFDSNKAADLNGAIEYLKLKKTYEVPKAILINSNGDSLYLLRDIAYAIKKVDYYKSDKVFNVIGKDQELPQCQLNLALRALGRSDAANKMQHINYELISLKGSTTKMSARRLQLITPLELFEKTKEAVLNSFIKERNYTEDEKQEIARVVAIGAVKYSVIAIGLTKKLVFDPEEVVSLNNNTSAFIQYAYARSQNILLKTDFKWDVSKNSAFNRMLEDEEWTLLLNLAKFPQIIQSVVEQIKPELICNYLFELANSFNKFYDNCRVLDAPTKELIFTRLAITYCAGLVLSRGLKLLAIESPKKM